MDKIVTTGMKMDLHIHSCYSERKDGSKVKENTIENLPILVKKLNENKVNICAITDHDTFNYELYERLKEEELNGGSIKKVLPGVEFSVKFLTSDKIIKEVHVVAVFSDSNLDKIKNIEVILNNTKPEDSAYSEECFLNILREIDIDTILIAHQKNYVYSKNAKSNDKNVFSLGEKKFLELIHTDYFEALEFKNRKNEIFNKQHLLDHKLEENIRYITGTDCHEWSAYPLEDSKDRKKPYEFPFTFAKCLPTFKGVVMAITDYNRLSMVNSFFNVSNNDIECIKLKYKDDEKEIPLSKGINVIIGDNSIGKSMLLHAMTDFTMTEDKLKKGYKNYLKELDMSVKTKIKNDKLFIFDIQGGVRSKFEGENLKFDKLLGEYFPPKVESISYKNIVLNEVDKMLTYLENKFKLDEQFNNLPKFKINEDDSNADSLSFFDNLSETKVSTENISNVINRLNNSIIEITELLKLDIKIKDRKYLIDVLKAFTEMKGQYVNDKQIISLENTKIERVTKIIKDIDQLHSKTISDAQKKRSEFGTKTDDVIKDFINLTVKKYNLPIYQPYIEKKEIEPESRLINNYEFISKLNVDCIDTNYFESLVSEVLKKGKVINWENITEKGLKDICNFNKVDESIPILESIRKILEEKISKDFKERRAIVIDGNDKFKELSSGMNAQIYFDLVAYENKKNGIYIIDQPEDNISQGAIKTLLTRFKTMAVYRQIIIVTHNPQFIVNLDIDNLIFLSKDDTSLKIQSGSLEYECEEYKILDIVANNIDGGLDTIKKRWKRYEKNVEIL